MQCYLNGEFLPLAQARISPLDRGFLFGDGVYEVIPIYRRRLFCRRRHLARLAYSLKQIRLPFAVESLTRPMRHLIDQTADEEQALYLQITRGQMRHRSLTMESGNSPTVFMMANARAVNSPAKLQTGIRCATAEDIRWSRCDIKSTSLLAAALLTPAADSAEEEVMIIRDGFLTEGSRSNFIAVKAGALYTPIADHRMLSGITYQMVVEQARGCGRSVTARDISVKDLLSADEIWLTSSTREMLPVVRVDDQPVGDGVPGPVFRQVHERWRAYINSDDWMDE